jgi:hypothetical protein
MSIKLLSKNNPVNVSDLCCNRCHRVLTRTGGNIIVVDNREKFICKECLDYFEAGVRRDYLLAYGGVA